MTLDMDWLTPVEAAEKWGIRTRRVQTLCAEGRIKGAKRVGRMWFIPCDATKPLDCRTKDAKQIKLERCEDKMKNQQTNKKGKITTMDGAPRLISLFSGCGGLDCGFERAGFQRVYANDFDTDAQAVFKLNFGEIDGRDILSVDEGEIPDGDILTAGFPCQPFSNAGNRKGVHDSRGMLYKECLRIIERKMPKVVLFENVKGLLSSKYIDGRNLPEVIIEDLSEMNGVGYNVIYKLINAADYGVPQNRQRVFFVGVRKDLDIHFTFPEKQPRENLTLRHILDIPEDVPNQVDWPFSPQAMDMVLHINEGGSWKDVPYEHLAPRFRKIRDNMKKYRSPNFYRRFSRDEINGTMTASAQPENCGIIHPTENRRYTIREVARIQSFSDDFKLIDDSLKDVVAMYKVLGNAVPPKLAYEIANAIKEQVFEGGDCCEHR